jgi:hypothetical protein
MTYYIAVIVTAIVAAFIFAHEIMFKVFGWTLKIARNSILRVLKGK